MKRLASKWKYAAAATVLAASLAGVVVAQGFADSGEQAAIAELRRLAAAGNGDVIVAQVNERVITRRDVEKMAAGAMVAGMADASGRPLEGATKEQLLDRLIEDALLVSAAQAAGIVVTESEIDMMIEAGIVGPLKQGLLPKDQEALLRESLRLLGTSPERAGESPELRASLGGWLQVNRYVGGSGKSREELLAEARAHSNVVIFKDALGQAPR